ncbi:MAG: hypothetical protein U1F43_28495 [Myxococcota bacterium]
MLAQLTDLDLAGTRVTDAGVAIVARIPTLARLWLNDLAGVTDHGAAALRRARALVRVNLSGTAVSLTGADALRAERPTLDVIRW